MASRGNGHGGISGKGVVACSYKVKFTVPPGTTTVISAAPRAASPIINSPFIIQDRSGKEAQGSDYIVPGTTGIPTLAN